MQNLRLPVAVLVLVALGVFSPAPASEDNDKAAFEALCGSCHPAAMADGLRSELEWKETVEQMVKIGARGSDQQFEQVMRFLLRNRTKVNVNTATASEIAPVLAVSDSIARAIVKRRSQIGGFKTIEQLEKVPGVDAAAVAARRDRIVF